MKRLLLLAFCATSVFGSPFKHERTINPGAVGPNHLAPDVALLANAKPSLGDLRIYAASGAEVPYLLIAPPTTEPKWRVASILPVASTKTTSGFEADLGATTNVDRLRVEGIAAPFLKRARLEGSGDRSHWTLLADETTLFNLPEEELRNLEITFAPGAYRYLRVTWDDRASARVRSVGTVAARVREEATAAAPVRIPLPYRVRASEPGKSRYRILLPGPHLPIAAIELNVTNGNVFRDASVTRDVCVATVRFVVQKPNSVKVRSATALVLINL